MQPLKMAARLNGILSADAVAMLQGAPPALATTLLGASNDVALTRNVLEGLAAITRASGKSLGVAMKEAEALGRASAGLDPALGASPPRGLNPSPNPASAIIDMVTPRTPPHLGSTDADLLQVQIREGTVAAQYAGGAIAQSNFSVSANHLPGDPPPLASLGAGNSYLHAAVQHWNVGVAAYVAMRVKHLHTQMQYAARDIQNAVSAYNNAAVRLGQAKVSEGSLGMRDELMVANPATAGAPDLGSGPALGAAVDDANTAWQNSNFSLNKLSKAVTDQSMTQADGSKIVQGELVYFAQKACQAAGTADNQANSSQDSGDIAAAQTANSYCNLSRTNVDIGNGLVAKLPKTLGGGATPPPPKTCPAGQHLDSSGNCVADTPSVTVNTSSSGYLIAAIALGLLAGGAILFSDKKKKHGGARAGTHLAA